MKFISFKKQLFFSLFQVAFFPIYPYSFISISTILFFTIVLKEQVVRKQKLFMFSYKDIGLILYKSFSIFLLLSLIYSQNLPEGSKIIFKLIPLFLVLPSLLILKHQEYYLNQVNTIKKGYVLSTTILAIYVLIKSIYLQYDIGISFYNQIKIVGKSTSILDLHPTYLSMYLVMAIFILLDFYGKNRNQKIVSILLILFFGAICILSASRMMIACLAIGSIIYIPKIRNKIFFVLLFISISLYLINKVETLKYQYKDVINSSLELPKKKYPSSINTRYGINYCSLQIIEKNVFLGVGIGDFQEELRKCYKTFETESLWKHNYNSHNFYFFLWGSAGILCFLSFLILIIYKISIAYKKDRKIELIFWILILLGNLTENLLVRSHGITFFIFFVILFHLSNEKNADIHNNPSL